MNSATGLMLPDASLAGGGIGGEAKNVRGSLIDAFAQTMELGTVPDLELC